jgi:hypothetical protein
MTTEVIAFRLFQQINSIANTSDKQKSFSLQETEIKHLEISIEKLQKKYE